MNKFKLKFEKSLKKDSNYHYEHGIYNLTSLKHFVNDKVEFSYLDYILTSNLEIDEFYISKHTGISVHFLLSLEITVSQLSPLIINQKLYF